jgi:FKBP-type peptidyl-prolyl cis-trans isomerase FklB
VSTGCNRSENGGVQLGKDVSYALAVKTTGNWIQDHPGNAYPALLRGMTDVAGGTTPMFSSDPVKLAKESEETNAESDLSGFNDLTEKKAYISGYMSAQPWKILGVPLDSSEIQRGFQDVINNTAKLTSAQANDLLAQADREVLDRVTQSRKNLAEKNLRVGREFLSKNASKSGIISLPSGLQYKVLASGGGNHPTPEDYVDVALHGTLMDGTPIDDFDKDNSKSSILCLRSVLPGFQEVLQLMSPGDKWQVFLPTELAYSELGAPNVGPNAVVIYTLELKKILPEPPSLTPEQIKEQNSQ